MDAESYEKDLIVLVADKDMQFSMQGILNRHQSLGIRPVVYDFFVDRPHDPESFKQCHNYLRIFHKTRRYALVLFDRDGCGQEKKSVDELTEDVENRLSINGWNDRARAVVIVPELENWVWSNYSEVPKCLNWNGTYQSMREWLEEKELWEKASNKPHQPKEAMKAVLRHVPLPPSSSIFKKLAENVSLKRCEDPSFQRLKSILQEWFPQ